MDGVEFVPGAYEAILDAELKGLIFLRRYASLPESMLAWIRKTIQESYDSAKNQPEYRYFLKNKFDFIH